MTREEIEEAFCLACCEGRPHIATCMSFGTCAAYDRFIRLLKNPWHKASEELPPYDKDVIVSYDGYTEDCCFNHRSNNPEVKTSENGWCDVGYDTEPTHWIEIPELPKED